MTTTSTINRSLPNGAAPTVTVSTARKNFGRAANDIEGLLAHAGGGRYQMNVLRLAANIVDHETITIGNKVFELHVAGRTTEGTAGAVAIYTTTAVATASDDIITAINAQTSFSAATVNDSDGVRVRAIAIGATDHILLMSTAPAALGETALAATETLSGANNAFSASSFYNVNKYPSGVHDTQVRTPTATEVALGIMHFPVDFTPVGVKMSIFDSAGALRSMTEIAHGLDTFAIGAVAIAAPTTYTPAIVSLDNSGTVDFAATDRVVMEAFGL